MPDKKLLLVTDHVYFEYKGEYFDNFGFTYDFFTSYLQVFDHVDVLCRMVSVESAKGLVKSSGEGVSFHGTPDIHGMRWFLDSKKYFKKHIELIKSTDAICYRIPATAAWNVHVLNQGLEAPKPHMFEFIGDPMDALFSVTDSAAKRFTMTQVGKVHMRRMKAISDSAVSGSYVSQYHLQKKFPPPAGVETEAISSIRLNEEYLRSEPKPHRVGSKLKIIQVASFVRQKNQTYLIDILRELGNRGIEAEVHFVGTGPLQADAKAHAREKGVFDDIIFHNQITGFDNVVKLLDGCDIFCLPSYSEGVPRSMIEAMARGLVCVGTDIGGIDELIEDEFRFPIGKPKAAADVIARLIPMKEDWPSIGERNTKKAAEFGQSILVPRRKKVYQQLRKHTE